MYISAHFFGWVLKMLIVRNWKFCMFLSIFFEFLELTFRHWLPNFHECWWDHIIFDVIVCNGGGILFGQIIINKFSMKVKFFIFRISIIYDRNINGQKKRTIVIQYTKTLSILSILPLLTSRIGICSLQQADSFLLFFTFLW